MQVFRKILIICLRIKCYWIVDAIYFILSNLYVKIKCPLRCQKLLTVAIDYVKWEINLRICSVSTTLCPYDLLARTICTAVAAVNGSPRNILPYWRVHCVFWLLSNWGDRFVSLSYFNYTNNSLEKAIHAR